MNNEQTERVIEAALHNATVDDLKHLSPEEKKALLARLHKEQSVPTVPWEDRVRRLFLALSEEEEKAKKTGDYIPLKDREMIR